MNDLDQLVLIAARKDDPFARDLSEYLEIPLCPVRYIEFPDDGGPMSGETKVEILDNLRNRAVAILFSISHTNYDLVVVLQLIDACRLSSEARRVTLIVPELPCARQDKTHERRESLSSRMVARLLEAVGLDAVLTVDLHSDQIEGHFRIPLDHLRTRPIWAHFIGDRYKRWMDEFGLAPRGEDLVLGVPDAGRARAVRELSDEVGRNIRVTDQKIKIRLAHHDKHRRWERVGQVQSHGLLGDVQDKVVWFTDDLLSSGGTLFGAAAAARASGARHVVCSVTHAHGFDKALKGGGTRAFVDALHESAIDELVVTDTHPRFLERVLADPRLAAKTTVLSLTPLIGDALIRIRDGDTIKEMMAKIEDPSVLYRVLHEASVPLRGA